MFGRLHPIVLAALIAGLSQLQAILPRTVRAGDQRETKADYARSGHGDQRCGRASRPQIDREWRGRECPRRGGQHAAHPGFVLREPEMRRASARAGRRRERGEQGRRHGAGSCRDEL